MAYIRKISSREQEFLLCTYGSSRKKQRNLKESPMSLRLRKEFHEFRQASMSLEKFIRGEEIQNKMVRVNRVPHMILVKLMSKRERRPGEPFSRPFESVIGPLSSSDEDRSRHSSAGCNVQPNSSRKYLQTGKNDIETSVQASYQIKDQDN